MELPQEIAEELAATARALATPGKGLLAADESTGTIGKRFASIGVENTEENRASYRRLLFSTRGLGEYCSGAILYEETLYQRFGEGAGESMVELLRAEGIVPGVKVDKGLELLPRTEGEHATMGLDGLAERCRRYYEAGARFAKWRAVLQVDEAHAKPSDRAVAEVAYGLARYAAVCQQQRLVPIVEPEVLADGAHAIERCAAVTERVLAAVFGELHRQGVLLEGALLKPNMVTAGSQAPKASPSEVAFFTLRALRRTVPPALPGVMFLSGGQSEEEASVNLNAINASAHNSAPWMLSFSFGRALQASALKLWAGKAHNASKAQEALLERAKANSLAQLGKYTGGAGGHDAQASLFEKKYVY